MTRQGYQRIEFVLDISADPRDAEISAILASLPSLARSEYIRRAIMAYAQAPGDDAPPVITADDLDRLWQTIEALQRQVEWLSTRPVSAPAVERVEPSSGLAMSGPRKTLKPPHPQATVEDAPFDEAEMRAKLVASTHTFGKGEG